MPLFTHPLRAARLAALLLSLPLTLSPLAAQETAPAAVPTPGAPAPAALGVSPLFGANAVLLRAEKVPVFGWDTPGQEVKVSFGPASATATAGENGRWQATLNLKDAPIEAGELVVEGTTRVASPNVIVGEVWLASGQSNMEWTLTRTSGAVEEIAAEPAPNIRQFTVKKHAAETPQEELIGTWSIAGPLTSGSFSGVAYYFAKDVSAQLSAPVGIIGSYWGGTPSEAWTSREGLATDPELRDGMEAALARRADFPKAQLNYEAAQEEWAQRFERRDQPTAAEALEGFTTGPATMENGWKPIAYNTPVVDADLPPAGAAWFRKTIQVMKTQVPYTGMKIGPFNGFVRLFVNGKEVQEVNADSRRPAEQFSFTLNATVLKEGENELALRVFAPVEFGNFGSDKATSPGNWDLPGTWMAKEEFALPPISAEGRAAVPVAPLPSLRTQDVATWLYNGMIHPLLPVGIRGAIWYQGESNAGRAAQYRRAFPLMIQDWREKWGEEPFPFYFCQLANYRVKTPLPGESGWAELREAQARTLALPNTGQAVLIDVGEEGDIHPQDKKTVGQRLARLALHNTYGKTEVVPSGPVYTTLTIEGSTAQLKFEHVADGLKAAELPATYKKKFADTVEVPLVLPRPDSELQGFALCGEDRKWVWADAKITAPDTVTVSHPEIERPLAVRYAWADNPTCNLYNSADLPASPFRTDDFPMSTAAGKYGPSK